MKKCFELEDNVDEKNLDPIPDIIYLQPGTLLAKRYVIIEMVGTGGMGAVYKATDKRLGNKLVAIKEMTSHSGSSEKQEVIQSFKREAQLLAILSHTNLPRVTDHFCENRKNYLVMDFINGCTLEETVKNNNEFIDANKVIQWALQICNVLDYLHNQAPPIIFRDLKPANIMIDKNEKIKLIDFGIARIFKTGQNSDTITFFTNGYAPPEQYGRWQTDSRSDIYALGATLHYILTRIDPTRSPFSFQPICKINPEVSCDFEKIIMKAVELKLEKRWQSAKEMFEAFISLNKKPSDMRIIEEDDTEKHVGDIEEDTIKHVDKENKIIHIKLQEETIPEKNTFPDHAIIVSKDNTGHYITINDAIKNAKKNGEIIVKPGLYQESLFITKDINIRGYGSKDEIIVNSLTIDCIIMTADKVNLKNMTLQCASGERNEAYGIDISHGHIFIENCNITSNSLACIAVHGITANIYIKNSSIYSGKEGGIIFYEKGTGVIDECDIYNNSTAGIAISDNSSPTIKSSKICNNDKYGIYIYENGLPTIKDCHIYNNKTSGILIKELANPTIIRCKIFKNNLGIYVKDRGNGSVENSEIYDNKEGNIKIEANSSLKY